jgi:hypothetical protein
LPLKKVCFIALRLCWVRLGSIWLFIRPCVVIKRVAAWPPANVKRNNRKM